MKSTVKYEPIPESITTHDKVETSRLGNLIFNDGYPTTETVTKIQE